MLKNAVVHEVMSDGHTISHVINEIIPGVELLIYYEADEAVLRFNEHDEIEFHWTPEAEALFANIDTAEPIELLELLARLNKSLYQKLADARIARKEAV